MNAIDTATCRRCKGTGRRLTLGGLRRCPCTPAPEKKRGPRAATHDGECGFCERRFTVGRDDNLLALHGFQRPGSGWLIGDCPGHGNLPVELSPVTIELLHAWAKTRAEEDEKTVAFFRSGGVTEFMYRVRRLGAPPFGRAAENYEFVTVKLGDRYDGGDPRGIPSFDDLLAHKIAEAEASAKRARGMENRAIKRIAEWAARELRSL